MAVNNGLANKFKLLQACFAVFLDDGRNLRIIYIFS